MAGKKTKQDLEQEIQELRLQLREVEQTLEAIRSGQVDALVFQGEQEQQVFMLENAEYPYRVLVEAMNEGAVALSEAGAILYSNRRFAEMVKTPRENLISSPFHRFVALPDQEKFKDLLAQSRYGRGKESITLQGADDALVPVSLATRTLRIDGLEGIGMVITDLTEIVAAEKEARFQAALLNQIQDQIVATDLEGRITYINQAVADMMKMPRQALIGQKVHVLGENPAKGVTQQEIIDKSLAEGRWQGTVVNYVSDGSERILESKIWLVYGLDGQPQGMVGISTDITDRTQAEEALQESNRRLQETLTELKATQEQVVQQERLAAVGQLAAGIAHDFNNILTSIIGFAELLQLRPDMPDKAREDLSRIVKQGERGANLVQQILDFGRKSISQPQILDLVVFMKESLKFLERTIPESIWITFESSSDRLPVRGDPTQLQQMLTNLAVNARDAMPAGGELNLRVSRFSLPAGVKPPCPGMAAGEWALLLVTDNGSGIPPEILSRIFDPFFTTKETGQGVGLGLAQVYGIVGQHKGCIHVASQPGDGTTFAVYLPLEVGARITINKESDEIRWGHNELILLVEDEPEVLAISQVMLASLGYQVLTASGGQQAIEIYARYQKEIALVLTDMVMPGMNGVSLFQVLKEQNPEVKVVMMTGYPLLGQEASDLLAQGIVDWLQKPTNLAQLGRVLRRALQ